MVFNSIEFVIFFVIFFLVYYFPLNEKNNFQNLFILLSSYVFYAWASWKILPILVFSTILFYWVGIAIHLAKTEKKKGAFTTLSLVSGIGLLLYFKYINFFITSLKDLFDSIGWNTQLHTFKIILPLGISFYTFRLLSYVIDVNRGKYAPTSDFVTFAAYVAFFPTILSGPIDRPNTLIPQLQKKRVFDYDLALDGCRQILWGAFKKIVVADNCAIYVNQVYDSYPTQSGSTLLLSAVFYTFQMYADFSGYSDMAIGFGKLLGFQITTNFNYPLFSQNIADFWRNWHISLTSWLTDYVFMPLNIKWRNFGNLGTILAIMITFELIGLWHGANWTFALFGLYHGLLYIPLILTGAMFKKRKIKINKLGIPKVENVVKMLLTFILVTMGLVLFRSDSISKAIQYFSGMIQWGTLRAVYRFFTCSQFVFIFILVLVEWLQRNKQHGLELGGIESHILKFVIYFVLLGFIFLFGGIVETYIYFQF